MTYLEEDEDGNVVTISVPFQDSRWEKPVFSGIMSKQGSFVKTWRRRFFILTHDGRLWYFKNKNAKEPKKQNPVYVKDMKYWSSTKKPNCIKIERYPRPFFFYGKTEKDKMDWLEKLGDVGGQRCEVETKSQKQFIRNLPDIAKKDVKSWKPIHVKKWLEFNQFSATENFSIYQDNLQEISGKDLLALTENDLKDKDIKKVLHRKKLMRAIRIITQRRTFNYAEYVVFKKIESMTKNFGKATSGNWKFLAKSLSDPDTMQETYLNPSILEESLEKYIGVQEEESTAEIEETEIRTKTKSSSPPANQNDENNSVEGENNKSSEAFDPSTVEEERCEIKNQPKEKLVLPVKLVVTEMVRSEKSKTARKLLSPVLSRIPTLSRKFGIFHTALIIGPWYLEWTDSSLCIPRKLYSGMALVSADVEASMTLKNMSFQELSAILARSICRWNVTMNYQNMNVKNKKDVGNCQDFVEDIMEKLSLTFEKEGAFARFLGDMKKSGLCELEFKPSSNFKEKFKLKLDKYRFDTHRELDDFVLNLSKEDEIALRFDYRMEEKLLKSFDRAFWLRHFKKPDEETFKPAVKCPFEDPRKTKSYIVYN